MSVTVSIVLYVVLMHLRVNTDGFNLVFVFLLTMQSARAYVAFRVLISIALHAQVRQWVWVIRK